MNIAGHQNFSIKVDQFIRYFIENCNAFLIYMYRVGRLLFLSFYT